jgi:hypothetical protein
VVELDTDLTSYVLKNYGHLMTEKENLADRHSLAAAKISKASPDSRNRLRTSLNELLSTDPEVLALLEQGDEAFRLRTAARIYSEHHTQIVENRCSKCGVLARTPRARQCRACGCDWHDGIEIPR